jgi:hypothetical protein
VRVVGSEVSFVVFKWNSSIVDADFEGKIFAESIEFLLNLVSQFSSVA